MVWALFQALVIFAVIASNIHWQWTPNTYLVSAIGIGVAFVATWLVGSVLIRIQTRRYLRGSESAGES